MSHRYVYLGDRLTDPRWKGQPCNPVLRADGRVVVGRSPRNQLVRFADGALVVVSARRLRLTGGAAPTNARATTTTTDDPQTNSPGLR